MNSLVSSHHNAEGSFRDAIEGALDLLSDYADQPLSDAKDLAQPLPSLLEQCQQLLADAEVQDPPPVRTIHHLACTGGTLISRCIAAQPNTQVLSEVDPLSPFVPGGFLPTDLIGLSRFSSHPASREIQVSIFLAGLRVLYNDAVRHGQQLILREHNHGHFNFGEAVPDRPSLREIIHPIYPVRSLVTVRHPLDSYLSLQDTGWVQHFSPPTLDEYAQRYHVFLDAHRDCNQIRYEDFVAEPEVIMQQICEILAIGYNPEFVNTFSAIILSGDSGRSGDLISLRPRRKHSPQLNQEADASEAFTNLLERLNY